MTPEDTPAARFAKDASRRAGLATLLDLPVFREALAIAEGQMGPQTGTQADAVPAIAAARFHQLAGANELVKRLNALTREPVKQAAPKGRSLARTLDDLPKDS